ncbi:hypothetical protein ABU614_08570 [Lysobacter firmicutimachus]|uniref:Uncharacterized protein n=1 Tax=Lysobacter firmicutimachus TaxID=1792846 RepID=A0AAU8MX18_9GAMM
MTKDVQVGILQACGRYVRKLVGPIEQRLARIEQRSPADGDALLDLVAELERRVKALEAKQ